MCSQSTRQFPDSLLTGIAIALENLLTGLRQFPNPLDCYPIYYNALKMKQIGLQSP